MNSDFLFKFSVANRPFTTAKYKDMKLKINNPKFPQQIGTILQFNPNFKSKVKEPVHLFQPHLHLHSPLSPAFSRSQTITPFKRRVSENFLTPLSGNIDNIFCTNSICTNLSTKSKIFDKNANYIIKVKNNKLKERNNLQFNLKSLCKNRNSFHRIKRTQRNRSQCILNPIRISNTCHTERINNCLSDRKKKYELSNKEKNTKIYQKWNTSTQNFQNYNKYINLIISEPKLNSALSDVLPNLYHFKTIQEKNRYENHLFVYKFN